MRTAFPLSTSLTHSIPLPSYFVFVTSPLPKWYLSQASTTRRSKKRKTTCFYDVFACTIIFYYNNIYLYIYIISEHIYIVFNFFFFTGLGIPFLRGVQALNLAWIIVGETYDVASSHAFRTKLLDQRQAPRTSIGGGWTGAHQLLRLGGWRDRKKRSLKLFPVGFGRIIADIRASGSQILYY